MKIAVVQWTGIVGGSEVLSVTLSAALRSLGVDVEVVLVTEPGALSVRLLAAGLPFRSLGFRRGRDVLRHPRAYARGVARSGAQGALLAECGFIGAALRSGGFRGPIVGVEHGGTHVPARSPTHRALRGASRLAGAWADDAEVGVSDWIVKQMRTVPHARHLERIHNGIDPAVFTPRPGQTSAGAESFAIGFAGRLAEGKGADRLIEALAKLPPELGARLLVAGDGPERPRLAQLARASGAAVDFVGWCNDMTEFWARCDVAVAPAETPESFGMTALEAMACGKPVIATRLSALPEIVEDGVTGTLVPPGDVFALAGAIVTYARSRALAEAHGKAGRARALRLFRIDQCALAYQALFQDLIGSGRGRPAHGAAAAAVPRPPVGPGPSRYPPAGADRS